MNVGGKEGLSIQDRTRNVAELLKVLMDINEINGGTNATAEKMKLHAKNFESALFAKSSSKEEYLDSMKEKVNAMKNTRDNRKKSLANGNSNNKQNNKQNNSNNNQQQQMQQQQQQMQPQQQQMQQMQQQQNGNMNYMPNTMNMNSQMFLNQQAQARQQAQQQLKDRQQQQQMQMQQQQPNQQPNQGQNQGQGQGQRQVLTPQQRQLINQMKVAPIPRELLQKIPNIPSDINTWQQITELAQQKRLTPHDMQIAKEVYKIHQQLLYKSKIQQVNANNNAMNMQQTKQQQMQQQMQQQQMQQQQMQQRQKDQQMGNNNSNNDGNNNNNNGNNSNSNNTNNGNNQPMFRNRNGEVPNVLGQINQIFTPDEQRALLQEAMEACKTFQKTQFGANMTDANRQSFIRKYINQKALKKIQSTRMAQQAAAAAQQQANQNDSTANNISNTNMNMNDSQNNNNNNNNSNNNNNVNVGNNGSNMQHVNNMQNMPQQNRNTPISQQQMQAQQQAQQAQQRSMPSSQGHQRTNSSQKASMLQLLQPTPQDIETVRKISTDAARTPLRLNDLTNVISPQEKDEIKRKLQMNQQLFAQVSNYAPQVYVFTKSEAFLKEVLQLRIFVKEILDKCSKGIYVVKLDTVDKLIMKYQKYWESMKIQILRRQQLIQQQQQLIRQKQQQNQQQPSGNNTPINSIPTPVQNNANMVQQQQRISQNQRAQSQNRQMQQQQQQQQMQWQQQQQQQQQQMNASNNNTPQMNNNYVQMNGGNMPNANVMNAKLNNRQPSVPIPPNAIMPNSNDNMMGQMPGSQFNTANATPDLGKINARNTSVPTSNHVSPSKEKTGTSNGTTKATNSKKPSPSTSASSKNGKSLSNVPTPRLNNNATTATAARSPGQKTTPQSIGADQRMKSNVETNPVFKKEEDELQSLNIKKTEISSRFKHRQEVFQTSPLDLFLSTLSDTLGLKDDEYEPQMKFSQDFIDLTNRTGKKKKLTKVAQRARERDPVDVMIVDGKKMVMKSKYMSEKNKTRNYGIKLSSISSIFNGLENNICEKLNDLAFIDTPLNNTDCNTKKRKLDEMNLTPDSIKSNVNDSPSIMSESKRIKFDSPEDTYVATDGKLKKGANEINFNNATATTSDFSTLTNGTTDDKKEINIWDWDYWANKV